MMLAAAVLALSAAQTTESRPPNILLILTDDQGSVDAGCYGSNDLETPALDALASRGTRFTQFYAAAPVCSPSRAALLTGLHPRRAGVPGNVAPKPGAGLPPEQITIAEMLREAGYATGLVGKWHLGSDAAHRPRAQGFDHAFGHLGGCIDNWSHFFYWNGPNRHDLWRNDTEVHHPGRFFPDLMVDEATTFITQHRDQPWFLYFAMNAPHYPYQGDPEALERFQELPTPRNLYAAFVQTLDARIGRLVSVLDDLGLRDDTLIVFQSDHGHSVEVRAHGGGGSAGPFRGAKFSLFEGGIRVPAVLSWPGHVPEGGVVETPAHACDWLPTLAHAAHIDLPDDDTYEGRNLLPVVEGTPSPERTFHWGDARRWAVRRGPWKLLYRPQDPTASQPLEEEWFLAHLDNDVGEQTNLAATHPEQVAALRALHSEWCARHHLGKSP